MSVCKTPIIKITILRKFQLQFLIFSLTNQHYDCMRKIYKNAVIIFFKLDMLLNYMYKIALACGLVIINILSCVKKIYKAFAKDLKNCYVSQKNYYYFRKLSK